MHNIFSKITCLSSGFINEDKHTYGIFTSKCDSVPVTKASFYAFHEKDSKMKKKIFLRKQISMFSIQTRVRYLNTGQRSK